MKKTVCLGIMIIVLLAGCKKQRYYDLTAGKYIEVEKDQKTGRVINAETNEPVYMYVDTKTNDTIYGTTGEVINGHVIVSADGKFKYDGDDEYKIKNGDYKKKVDGDEVKIKDGDTKIKIEDDEKKVKKDD